MAGLVQQLQRADAASQQQRKKGQKEEGGQPFEGFTEEEVQASAALAEKSTSGSGTAGPAVQTKPPPAAAVLLDYCLSDLPDLPAPESSTSTTSTATASNTTAQAVQAVLRELDGLPLLPLADGTLGILRAQPPGPTVTTASATGGSTAPTYLLAASDAERALLAEVPGLVLCAALPAGLAARLGALASQGGFLL